MLHDRGRPPVEGKGRCRHSLVTDGQELGHSGLSLGLENGNGIGRFGPDRHYPTIGSAVSDYVNTTGTRWVDWEDREKNAAAPPGNQTPAVDRPGNAAAHNE